MSVPFRTTHKVVSLAALGLSAGLLLLPGFADAARRDGPGQRFEGRKERIVVAKKFTERTTVRRSDGKRGDTGRPPKRGDTADGGKPPKNDRPPKDPPGKRPDPRPKPPKDDVATPDRPRPKPPKPPIIVVCDGGRIVRASCVCPSNTRRASRGNGAACIDIVVVPRPPRPDRPIIVRPIRPDVPVTTFVPPTAPQFEPLTPSVRPPQPPAIGRPQNQPPFTPAPALADATLMPDEVIVAVSATAPTTVEDGLAARFNLTLLERTQFTLLNQRVIRYRIPDGRLVPAVVAAVQQDADAIAPQANYIYRPQQGATAPPSDTLQYAIGKVELATAHTMATGRGTVIGMIDSGVDTAHADLKGSDILTFDAAGGAQKPDGHGTAIAGIIGARGFTRGMAPGARLVSARAFAPKSGTGPQLTTTFILLKSLDWIIENKARVVNLSLAGPEDPMLRTAVASAQQSGMIIVAAAGNNGPNAPAAYPAAYAGVIATTAVDANDRLYDKANTGRYVAIAAPGVDVIAPTPSGTHDLHTGTSFAAAHVTGIVALMLEQNPGLTSDAARKALTESAQDLGKAGIDDEYGAGRVNAAAALRFASEPAKMSANPR